MSEEEFWKSTWAKVHALSRKKRLDDRRRDYFVALVAALQSQGSIKIEDIMSIFYEMDKPPERDPDDGAILVG